MAKGCRAQGGDSEHHHSLGQEGWYLLMPAHHMDLGPTSELVSGILPFAPEPNQEFQNTAVTSMGTARGMTSGSCVIHTPPAPG